jgi:hypothetical protein
MRSGYLVKINKICFLYNRTNFKKQEPQISITNPRLVFRISPHFASVVFLLKCAAKWQSALSA